MTTVAFVSPRAAISSTQGSVTKCAISAAGSVAVAITSRSRNVSRPRRTLPAPETSTAAGMRAQRLDDLAHDREPDAEEAAPLGLGPEALRERLEDLLLALRAEPLERRGPAAARPPARSSSSVVTPSSRQIRAAVFGPSPGSRRNWRTSAGTSARRFSSAAIEPVSVISTIFASIVAPIPGSSFAEPCERELRDRRAGLADPRRRPAVGEDAESLLPEDLGHVGELVERVGDVGVAGQRRHPSIIGTSLSQRRSGQTPPMSTTRAVVCVPTYNERDNVEALVRALGEVLDTAATACS